MVIDANLDLLRNGEFSELKRIPVASNASIFCKLSDGMRQIHAIYKPIAGERPLWDFQEGNLAFREYATYLIDRALGINAVPTTILRNGPYGLGAVQYWIEEIEDPGQRFTQDLKQLRNIALLDVVVNNTDRKIGHLLFKDDQIYACDHGVTFHSEYKLRTVLWQFADSQLNLEELEKLNFLIKNLPQDLPNLITQNEISALKNRISDLLTNKKFPLPPTDWPAIPWPPF